MEHDVGNPRFLPYIQVHEYEALLFSDPDGFAEGIGQQELSSQFHAIREECGNPEEIDDDPNTAPSNRITACHPRYSKVIDGTLAAQQVGLAAMRAECPHFREWLEKLAALSPSLN